MSTLKIDTGNGNVLDCIQVVEDVVMKHGDEIDAVCWQRLKPRLTPDRERVARAMYDDDLLPGDVYDWDDATLEDRNYWRAKADAAIRAMGETP